MPINPQHEGSFTFKDFSKEPSTMSFYFGAVTAVSIGGFLTQFGALRTATEAIVLGALVGDQWSGDVTKYDATPPTDVNAQRERKFLVLYQGTTTFSKYRLEIPIADFTARLVDDTDLVNLAQTEIAAWITAFEALCKTPEGEAVEVLEIRAVGRAL